MESGEDVEWGEASVSGVPLSVGVGRGVEVGVAVGFAVTRKIAQPAIGHQLSTQLSALRNQGLGCGVGRALGIGVGRGVAVGVGVAVAVAVGVGVAVAVGVGVGDGAGTSPGAWIKTPIGEPVLKKPTVASVGFGGWSASNRKL